VSSTTWPEGVIARYLTVGGATVDVTVRISHDYQADIDGLNWIDINHQAVCAGTGCGSKTELYNNRGVDDTEQARRAATDLTSPNGREIKQWAQSHAETCRAMPNPSNA
jgi:hypothetical protein